jgi:hypothetical protein
MFFSGCCSYKQPSIFICLSITNNLLRYNTVHDYLWYLDLGNSSGWPYLSTGLEALSSLEEQ